MTGRFISMDDVEYIDPEVIGGANLFAYCNNNPVMNADPSGNFLISLLISIAVGVAVGFGGTVAADIADDGKVFNGSGSVSWQQYLGNTLIGAGIGATLALGSVAITEGLKSVGVQLVADGFSSLVTGTNQFGSLQEYALSFATSGIVEKTGKWKTGLGLFSDIVIEPVIKQLVDKKAYSSFKHYGVEVGVGLLSKIFKYKLSEEVASKLLTHTIVNNLNW